LFRGHQCVLLSTDAVRPRAERNDVTAGHAGTGEYPRQSGYATRWPVLGACPALPVIMAEIRHQVTLRLRSDGSGLSWPEALAYYVFVCYQAVAAGVPSSAAVRLLDRACALVRSPLAGLVWPAVGPGHPVLPLAGCPLLDHRES
jgi:hypothetical protein